MQFDSMGAGTTVVPVVLLVLLFAVLVVLLLVIWSIKRHRDPHLSIDCNAPVEELIPSLTGLTHGTSIEGNAVEILENGAFFDVLLQEMRQATRSVHFESFLWKEGTLGQRVADALAERSRAGVPVRVLVDARRADLRVPQNAASPEGHDHRGCLVRSRTSNFDDRSFEINDEITLGFKDAALSKQLEDILERDAADCIELKLETWRKRGL